MGLHPPAGAQGAEHEDVTLKLALKLLHGETLKSLRSVVSMKQKEGGRPSETPVMFICCSLHTKTECCFSTLFYCFYCADIKAAFLLCSEEQ